MLLFFPLPETWLRSGPRRPEFQTLLQEWLCALVASPVNDMFSPLPTIKASWGWGWRVSHKMLSLDVLLEGHAAEGETISSGFPSASLDV